MTHWLQPVTALLQSDTSDFRELAKIAGVDPRRFYFGASLDGANLCGQDLRGMEFTGLNRAAVLFDHLTRLEPRYLRQLIENPNARRVLSKGHDNIDQFDELEEKAGKLISEIVRDKLAADRAARIFRAMLDNRNVGLLVTSNYPDDRSVMESKAVRALSAAAQESMESDDATLNVAVIREMDELLKSTIMYRKSDLLLAFIRHLGDILAVRPFLISKVKRSQSFYFSKKEIEEKLGLPDGVL